MNSEDFGSKPMRFTPNGRRDSARWPTEMDGSRFGRVAWLFHSPANFSHHRKIAVRISLLKGNPTGARILDGWPAMRKFSLDSLPHHNFRQVVTGRPRE